MTDDELAARRLATQQSFYTLLPHDAPADGVVATVVPASPDRSLFNAVTYGSAAAVVPLIPSLAERYEGAGVRAWTVWVLPGDAALAEALREAGHVLDAAPEAMGAVLSELDLSGPDVACDCTWDDVVETNALAYGAPREGFDVIRLVGDGARLYAAEGGAIVLIVHDHDGDAGVTFVAARPEARGRGVVAALMRQALRDAVDRGCTTTSLESTKLGRPVYDRVGYRPLGPLEMWERRTA